MSEIRCPQCNALNRDTARYCAECGTPLLGGVSRLEGRSSLRTTGDADGRTSSGSSGRPTATPANPACGAEELRHGRYRVLAELGRGGFGAIYAVWDTNLN